jgi:hypothetical protein
MKKRTRKEMRNHYDFTGGVRGKYARRYAEGTNVVVLDPDVARLFPNRDAVNETLRAGGRLFRSRNEGETGLTSPLHLTAARLQAGKTVKAPVRVAAGDPQRRLLGHL